MSRLEIGDPERIKSAAGSFACAAAAPADAVRQLVQHLDVGGGPVCSGLDNWMLGTLDSIRTTLDGAARSRAGRADEIHAAAVETVDAIVAADLT